MALVLSSVSSVGCELEEEPPPNICTGERKREWEGDEK
jgi:hypothetical protein